MQHAAKQIEKSYCRNQSQQIYLALEELNFTWNEDQIKAFEQM